MRIFSNRFSTIIVLSFYLSILLFSQSISAQQLSFPTAYGAGAYTTGGRGGVVVHVTNLNDKGNGSLREALQMRVPRTIVFDVSGVITLKSVLYMFTNNSNVTIAGQTAPEGGITIDGHRLMMESVDNVICRYIRFRGGITAKGLGYDDNDSFSATGNIKSHIFDHCSFSWDGDETGSWFSSGGNFTIDKVTVQRSFFGEGQKGSLFGGGSTVKTGSMSLHHSLYYNVTHRTPNISGYGKAAIETINNVVWTISHRLIQSNGNLKWNHIGNYYDYGNEPINNGNVHMQGAIDENPPQIYTNGNKIVAVNSNTSRGLTPVTELNADNRKSHRYFQNGQGHVIGEKLNANYFTNKQHPLLGNPIPVQSAIDAFSSVKSDVGCNARLHGDGSVSDNRDVLDIQWLNNVKSGRYVPISNSSKWKVPPINSVKRPNNFYISNPHIPEAFFKAYVPKGKNHNDIAPSGYTWLEEYLNGVDKFSNSVPVVQRVEVSPSIAELQVSKTLQLEKTIKPNNTNNQSGVWSSSNENIAKVNKDGIVTAISAGDVSIAFKSTEIGLEGKSEITIIKKATLISAGENQNICKYFSTTLTATGGANYLWSTGEKTASINVSPKETTVYSVTTYDSSGREAGSDNVRVTVNPQPNVSAGKNVTINHGESTTLTATGANTYLWSNGATTASIKVSPLSRTSYTVTGTSIHGCEATKEVLVMIRNTKLPMSKVSAGEDQNICKYSNTTLTATGGTTYLWSTGEKTASINVSPKETTVYSVTAYDNSGGDSGSDNVTVTVNSQPSVSAGKNVTINHGESTTLTATGANTYLWSNGATTASIRVSPSSRTTYTVTGTSIDGCQASKEVLVMIRDTKRPMSEVSAGDDQNICKYFSTILTATGGASYQWSTGEKTASISDSPRETTVYSVTAYDSSGREVGSDNVRVTVNPQPNVSAGKNVTINAGESTTLTATGASTYSWSNGATTASIKVSPASRTYYTVTGTSIHGCEATKEVLVMIRNVIDDDSEVGRAAGRSASNLSVNTESSTKHSVNSDSSDMSNVTVDLRDTNEIEEVNTSEGTNLSSETISFSTDVKNYNIVDPQIMEDTIDFEFLIYPNPPTDGQLHIKISGLTDISSIHLYDLSGKSLYSQIIHAGNQTIYTKTLDLSDYESGVYLLQLVSNQRVITKKVVLK